MIQFIINNFGVILLISLCLYAIEQMWRDVHSLRLRYEIDRAEFWDWFRENENNFESKLPEYKPMRFRKRKKK